MEHKIVIVAFAGEAPCFAHALLNGLDMRARGWDVKLVIEGRATALIKELAEADVPLAPLYGKAKKAGLIDCVCRACQQDGGVGRSRGAGLAPGRRDAGASCHGPLSGGGLYGDHHIGR